MSLEKREKQKPRDSERENLEKYKRNVMQIINL